MATDQVGVALVAGVDGDGGVGQHRLRAHRRHSEDAIVALDRIVDRVEDVLDLAVLDLGSEIAECDPGSQLTM
jgi:hypothetical protein